jgi:hypothetical protein
MVAIGYLAGRSNRAPCSNCEVTESSDSSTPGNGSGLDEEFKRIVAEMNPHAKKLPQKSSEEPYS